MSEPEHVLENRRYWDENAADWVASGERNWSAESPTWGIWGIPESEVDMLPADMTGMKTIELGCGTGYVSGWLARRGAAVTGIDNSEQQLATARRLATEHGVPLELVHGNAETTPFADESFDFAISEYGAAIWCEPAAWIPEAHRILKPGGQLVFLGHHPLTTVCSDYQGNPVGRELIRPYFGMGKVDWTDVEIDPGGIEFSLPVSEWFALFRRTGFSVENYLELRPGPEAGGDRFSVSAGWARDFPSEQVWILRKL